MIWRRRFTRSLDLSFFNSSFCWQTSPSNLTLRFACFACFAGLFLRRLCFPSIFHTLQIIVARDYKSILRDITNQSYEILHFGVARYHASSLRWYHASSLREITNHCCSHYIRISIIQSAVTFYRRYEWTVDGLFSRPFFFQLFFLAIKNPRPSLLSASRASPVYSYGAYARGYCSGLLLGLTARAYCSACEARTSESTEQRAVL
jgi:hypothetical protein